MNQVLLIVRNHRKVFVKTIVWNVMIPSKCQDYVSTFGIASTSVGKFDKVVVTFSLFACIFFYFHRINYCSVVMLAYIKEIIRNKILVQMRFSVTFFVNESHAFVATSSKTTLLHTTANSKHLHFNGLVALQGHGYCMDDRKSKEFHDIIK